jgi:hypothetical protein
MNTGELIPPAPRETFDRHLPGLLAQTPAEVKIIGAGLAARNKIMTPEEAKARLTDMGYGEEVQDQLFAKHGLNHEELAKIVISRGVVPRIVSILNLNIRALIYLELYREKGKTSAFDERTLQQVLSDSDMQSEALRRELGH